MQGIWSLLKEELAVLLTQKNNGAIGIALKPYSPDSEINTLYLSSECYQNNSNIIKFDDLVINNEQLELAKAKKIFYSKDPIEKETDPKHLEKIYQFNNDLINAIHSEEPYGDLEKEKSMYCSSTTDYQALISSLKLLLIRFAELDPKKRMKNEKPIQGDYDRGVVGAILDMEDFQIKGKSTLQSLFREAMNKG